jgi:hypothetical protein
MTSLLVTPSSLAKVETLRVFATQISVCPVTAGTQMQTRRARAAFSNDTARAARESVATKGTIPLAAGRRSKAEASSGVPWTLVV